MSFREKAADLTGRPGTAPGAAYVSMGNYLFDRDVLVDALSKDAVNDRSGHSMGGDIIPMLVRDGAANVYDFLHNQVPGAAGGTRATGRTWARWTPTSARTWTCARTTPRSGWTTTGGRS